MSAKDLVLRRIGYEGPYNIGCNDAAKATIDQESMKADAGYRRGEN